MPRRNRNAEIRKRGAYRPEAGPELERIEEKRLRLKVTLADLASRTGLTERTLRNMRRQKRAFPRHIRALTFALRTIEREQEAEGSAL